MSCVCWGGGSSCAQVLAGTQSLKTPPRPPFQHTQFFCGVSPVPAHYIRSCTTAAPRSTTHPTRGVDTKKKGSADRSRAQMLLPLHRPGLCAARPLRRQRRLSIFNFKDSPQTGYTGAAAASSSPPPPAAASAATPNPTPPQQEPPQKFKIVWPSGYQRRLERTTIERMHQADVTPTTFDFALWRKSRCEVFSCRPFLALLRIGCAPPTRCGAVC